ncbi:MAG TPA: hypothetical protein VIU93_02705 [Gallionellaceae bacterium]
MSKRIIVALVLCSIFFLTNAFGADAEILFPGNVITLDLHNKKQINGARFMALYKIDGRFAVEEVVVSFGPSSNEDITEIVSSKKNTIALFRNTNIRSGDVQTVVEGLDVDKNSKKLSLGSSSYVVRETQQGLSLGGPDGLSSIIGFGDVFHIIWAGDLDRDGKLDLIVYSSDAEGKGATSCLFLSSVADMGKLVKKMACQGYSG